jgi:hypothetical protein
MELFDMKKGVGLEKSTSKSKMKKFTWTNDFLCAKFAPIHIEKGTVIANKQVKIITSVIISFQLPL